MATTFKSLITSNLPSLIETIEIRSRFSPPVTLKVADLLREDQGKPNAIVQTVKPTIILRGPGVGTQVIAPAGRVGPDEWKLPAAAVAVASFVGGAVVVSTIFGLGRFSGRRKAMRSK